MILDKFKRYQVGLTVQDLYPIRNDGICACGCGRSLTGRKKRWASRECNDRVYFEFEIIKGNGSAIRTALFAKEEGYCRTCGVYDEHWEADHIIPVFQGGGGCGITNFQTLCPSCHKLKTKSPE